MDLRACGPGGTADPYARVSLSAQAGCRHEMKVHRGTLCPTFQETCYFHVHLGWVGRGPSPGAGEAQLTPLPAGAAGSAASDRPAGVRAGLRALLCPRAVGRAPPAAGRRQPAARPGAVVPAGPAGHRGGEAAYCRAPAWPCSGCRRGGRGPSHCLQAELAGELCFSLRYVPSSGWLTVVVLEARGLSLGLAGESRTCPSAWPCARPSDLGHL